MREIVKFLSVCSQVARYIIMSISVLSKIPNLLQELQQVGPKLLFKAINESTKDQLKQSDIIIADFDLLINNLQYIQNPKWIQSTWAGVDKFLPYFTKDKFHSTVITRFSGDHFGRLMSEYVVSNIVNYERNICTVFENKKHKLWSQDGRISQHRSIADLTIGILGIGNIGNYIAKILHNFGAQIWGFGKRDSLPKDEKYKHYIEYCTKKTLPRLLSNCDYVVNVLPSTDETRGLLNEGILQNCTEKKSVFINIGRGSIISETELLKAINNNWISGAILDVFETEPLPKDSLLWSNEKIFITPHVAGVSRAKDIAQQFIQNYKLFENGKNMPAQLMLNNNY